MKKKAQSTVTHRYNPKVIRTDIASEDLQAAISNNLGKQVSKDLLTGLSKIHGSHPIPSDSKLLSHIADNKGLISIAKLQELMNSKETHTRGTPVSDEAVKRIYQGFCSSEGKMSFEYLVKMGEEIGVPVPPQMAKALVRRHGHHKGYLSVEDCL